MTIIQELQKNQMRKIEFQNLQKICQLREKILLFFFEKGTFLYKVNVFKTKEEKSEDKSEEESEEESKEERI